MLIRLLLLLALLSPTLVHGNNLFPGIEFEKTYWAGGTVRDIKVWPDGTVTFLGNGLRATTIDPMGKVLSDTTTFVPNYAAAIAPDRSAFWFNQYQSGGGQALALRKYSPEGQMIWSTNYPGYHVNDFLPTDDGGTLVLYTSRDYSLKLLRLNSEGGLLWDKALSDTGAHPWYWSSGIYAVGQAGYVVGSISESGVSSHKSEANFGDTDVWIIRLNEHGEKLWDKTIGGSGVDSFGGLNLMDDGFCIGASTSSGDDGNKTTAARGGSDIWLIELDSQGTIRRQEALGGGGDDIFLSLVPIADGYALLARSSSPADGAHKTAPAASPSGTPRTEWLLLLDEDFHIRVDESYETPSGTPPFAGVLVANQDESLLRVSGPTVRRLSLRYAPVLAFEIDTQEVFVGKPVTLKLVGEQRVPGTTFQWALDGGNIQGATNQAFFIPEMGEDDAGNYQVTVTTPFGAVTSKAITLAVAYAEVRIELVPSLIVQGLLGTRYRIETSTPLAPSTWTPVDSLTLTNNPQRWIDLNAPPGQRFYRVRRE